MTHQGISIDGLIQASEALRPQVKKADVEARRNAAIELELAGTELDAGRDCHTTIVESSLQPKKEIQGDESRGSESSPTAGEVTSTGGSKLMEGTHGVGSTQTFDGCTSEALDTATATTDTSISLTMEVSS